jgi:Rieske Fe-S protein
VVATNIPINDLLVIHTKQAAYRTYAIAARVTGGAAIPRALVWDTAAPYHYLRPAVGRNDLAIVGGEDHRSGQRNDFEERFHRLESWLAGRFSSPVVVERRWSGQVMETVDGLAFIGRNPGDEPNVYVATGDSGMGLTHGAIAGMLVADLVAGRPNPWAGLYDPSRKPLAAAVEYLKENVKTAAQYGDWLKPGDASSAEEVAPGTGAVVRRGLKMIAAYRDETGALHECSAVCPHLGCVVTWNGADGMWDCPCHGSRFDPDGTVVLGPANSDLAAEGRAPGATAT